LSNVHGIDDATALVGMPEFVVRAQVLRDGEWWLAVETPPGPQWCPGCGIRAVGHGRSRTTVRDLPIAGVPTVLVFARRRWRCPEPLCEMRTWSEHVDAIAPRASLTERSRARLAEMVNVDEFSIAAAAAEFGVGWHTANAAVADYTDPHINDPARLEGVRGIGVDEKRFLNATATHRTWCSPLRSSTWTATGSSTSSKGVLVTCWPPGWPNEGRSGAARSRWQRWILQPATGRRSSSTSRTRRWSWITSTPSSWPTRQSTTSAVACRTNSSAIAAARAIRSTGPRRVFLTGIDRLSDERITWMFDMLAAGEPHGEVGAAIAAKELLREVYAASDLAHARRRLIVFFQHCADADVAELGRLARTIDRWSGEVLAYHHTGRASTGRVENVHMLAEKTRRNAHGFTNHYHDRRRLIGRPGIKWATVPTRRIRGRQPRSVA
jgi:hypothetical protein